MEHKQERVDEIDLTDTITTENTPQPNPPTLVTPPSSPLKEKESFTEVPLEGTDDRTIQPIHEALTQTLPPPTTLPPESPIVHGAPAAEVSAAEASTRKVELDVLKPEETEGGIHHSEFNLLKKITFSYVIGLVQKAQNKQLDMNDIFVLPAYEQAGYCYEEFKTGLAATVEDIKTVKYVLFHTFKRLYWHQWLIAVVLYGVSQAMTIANAPLLSSLIDYVQDLDKSVASGWVVGMIIVLLPLLASFFFNHGVIFSMRLSQKMRVALNMAIYDKALRMSCSNNGTSIGEIVDILNNDANKIVNSFHEIIFGIVAPIQIVVITALLYGRIQYFAFVAIGAIAILVLPNVFVAKGMHKSRKAMLGHTDERLRSTAELITGMRAIKCYVWEKFFMDRIAHDRKNELIQVRKFAYLKACLYFLISVLPSLAALSAIAAYVLSSESNTNNFDAKKAFVTLTLLNMIRFPLAYIPVMIITISANMVAFGRIQKFLAQPEAAPPGPGAHKDKLVVMQNANFSWTPNTETSTLSNMNLELLPNQFTIVVGSVGSGKTSLLQAILGEITKESGDLEVNGTIGYVPQAAWILNATVKENILMGAPYDNERFTRVTDVCALDSDIAMLSSGIHTQIGEKGVNLSGGQQQRVSLARAMYSEKDIYLLDDCLSAVDQRVAKHIFEKCITGYLRGKTVVMITNHIHFVPNADKVLVINNNTMVGQFNKSTTTGDELITNLHNLGIDFTEKKDEVKMGVKERRVSVVIPTDDQAMDHATVAVATATAPAPDVRRASQFKNDAKNLVQEEERMKGKVPWSVYAEYVRTGGATLFVIVAIMFSVALSSHAAGDYWLSIWTGEKITSWAPHSHNYLAVYASFAVLETILQSIASFSLVSFGVKAAAALHDRMLISVANAKIGFFDANPLGRIMNRFSRDQDMIDTGITERMYQFFAALVLCIAIIVILGVTSFWIAIACIPIAIGYFFLQKHYRKASIELKRLEGIAKSPLLSQMVETIAGVTSIRAFGLQSQFLHTFMTKVDGMNYAYYSLMVSTQWLGLILDMLGVGVLLATVLDILIRRQEFHDSNYALVGLAILYATNLRFALNFSVLASTQTEITMNGAERIMEYSELPQEPTLAPDAPPTPERWPSDGRIEFVDVDVRYRPGLDPVLKQINCAIQPGEKIGIVGRTGAGKSTFTATMFRLVDVTEGQILIDGVDIMSLPVQTVRAGLTILPQNPMLFMGTMRQNIDPFAMYPDEELWQVLEVVQLKTLVSSLPLKLEAAVDEDGDNFSQGQKQLVCLARALLRKSKVLILDEAMANIDFHTEAIINEAIRSHLQHCTVLTIAHRLASIMNSDRVMVMEKGRLMEMDSPANLLANTHSKFYNMVNNINEIVE